LQEVTTTVMSALVLFVLGRMKQDFKPRAGGRKQGKR